MSPPCSCWTHAGDGMGFEKRHFVSANKCRYFYVCLLQVFKTLEPSLSMIEYQHILMP